MRLLFFSGLWLSFYALDVGGEHLFWIGIVFIVLAYVLRMTLATRDIKRL
ncbi:MAG: hypothetical protein RBR24_04260 [Candidatus Carbobacillus sp.]|nr:hypothetical protein [Candidatus Carbobacillus sp.]